jgi:sugar phosphate permease
MDQSLKQKYSYWQWRTIIVLMIGYALYYFVRKNLSIAMPALESELGLSKAQLGLFLTLNGIIYGLSRFVNGLLADRFSRKKIMAAGLFLSAMVSIIIGMSPKMNGVLNLLDSDGKATIGLVYLIGCLWVMNGYFQGMGVPPCGSLMAHWIKPSELATKQSIWNTSHSIGAGLVAAICGWILEKFTYSAWQWCFFVPAIMAIFGVVIILLGLKDTPESVGLPEASDLEAMEKAEKEGRTFDQSKIENVKEEDDAVTAAAFKKFLKKLVFGNPIIWILALANFCIYVIRLTILDWGTSFLTQFKGMDIGAAGSVVASSEIIGGIIGMLVAGWATDKFFGSRAHRTCLIGTLGATLSFLIFWKAANVNVAIIFLVLSSFFIYMPQALLGIAASNQATKRAAASANGILGIFGYLSQIVSGIVFGAMADTAGGWNSVFTVAVAVGFVGVLITAVLWNVPADGYAKAEKVMAEVKEELEKK